MTAWRSCFASFRLVSLGLALLLLPALTGCGGRGVSPVKGTVTFKGKPVTGGTLSFSPISSSTEAGKPGAAQVQSDGTFTVSTYGDGDGAIVGKHKVSYQPPEMPYPEGRDPRPGEPRPRSGFEGLVVKTPEVEIKSGDNNLTIELGYPGR